MRTVNFEAINKFGLQGALNNGTITKTGMSPDYDLDYNVRAWCFFLDFSRPIFGGKLIPHTGFFFASGDDDLADDSAEGFDSISDKVNVWGDRGIVIDDRLSIRVRGLEPLMNPIHPVKLTNPATGKPLFVDLTNPQNPFLPGKRLIAPKSSSMTIVRDDSPYVALRDSDSSSNFINPGVMAWNVGAGFNPYTWLSGNINFTYFWFEDPELLETATEILRTFLPRDAKGNPLPISPWNPSSQRVRGGGITRDIGWEVSTDANLTITKHLSAFTGAAIFVPDDDNFEKLFGDSDIAANIMLGLQMKF
ncbi:MAG: hypothetical protein D6828_02705 [Nitrospirae bacterium]|nr:MAG: hypothetical protein D6828_02705 [Nitrospirota bacterium]